MENQEQIIRFYEQESPEELRLMAGSIQRIEFETATLFLERYLPPGGAVLDSCAGVGEYAFWLAERGYAVTAGDIVARNVEKMRARQTAEAPLAGIYEGDALDLSAFEDNTFDVALCMGALYHMHSGRERARVVGEHLRVLKPGGLFVCVYMNRYAVLLNNLQGELDDIEDLLQFAKTGKSGLFFASTPEQAEALCTAAGAELVSHIALDGPSILLFETTARIHPGAYERWKQLHLTICEQPSMLGAGYHNMIIARKQP